MPGAPAVYQAMMFTGSPAMAVAELLVMMPHGAELTHIDALSHAVARSSVISSRREGARPAGDQGAWLVSGAGTTKALSMPQTVW